jgi:hypothetical protein
MLEAIVHLVGMFIMNHDLLGKLPANDDGNKNHEVNNRFIQY